MKTQRVALLLLNIACALALVLPPRLSRAALRAEVTDEAMRKAKAHFKRGKAHQDGKEYDQAIVEYRAAYELAPLPELLFNLGQVYRLAGNRREALWHYRRFLEAQPNGVGSDEARDHITRLSRQLEEDEEREEARRRRAAAEGPPPAPREVRDSSTEIPTAAPRLSGERDPHPGRALRIAGIATAVTGGLVLVWGIAKGIEAKQAADTIEGATEWTDEQRDALNTGPASAQAAYILYGVGGALMATGGILYYYGHRARADATARARIELQPVVSPQSAGLSLHGRF